MNNQNNEFAHFVSTELNSEQQKAVSPKDGSFLVIAGAGSGKTRVITARITNLIIHHNVEPSSIVALTFTNKAAQEMRERINKFLPNLQTKPIIATFHSYCLRLLQIHKHLLSYETFSIIDAADQYKLLQGIVKDHGVNNVFNVKSLLAGFSAFKMADLLKFNYEPMIPDHHLQQFIELYNAYEQQKRVSNYFDFDDLLYKTYTLFTSNDIFKQQHHNRHKHILVDEYQDTNIIQHELLKQMTLYENKLTVDSVCAVGDEDQSIYSWRGAVVKNILDFDKEFKHTKVIKLEQNYRSTQRILDIANHVIINNSERKHKKLWSDNSNNHTPLELECLSDLQEAYTITNAIHSFAKKDNLSSIAVLYRTHYQSRIIEEALIKESIPYKMIGGIQFYERKEIKDILAYLRLVVNPFDKISFLRVVNCPTRGLGKKFEELFLDNWAQNPFLNFKNLTGKLISDKILGAKQQQAIENFIKLFNNLNENSSPTAATEQFIKQSEYIAYLQDNFDKQEAQIKRENIAELIRAAQYAEKHHKANLSSFLDEISLMQAQIKQDDDKSDCVQMMTLHSAKGLEFTNVILSGLEDGILPSNQSIEQGNTEEERRLFYVGLTRAKQRLLLMHSKYRNTFGQMTHQKPSRFLQEIPSHLLIQQPATHWSKSQFKTFFEQWLTNHHSSIQQPRNDFSEFRPPSYTKTNDIKLDKQKIVGNLKRLQTVKHRTFGIGIAHLIEEKGDKTFVTVHFTNYGKKKIEKSFLDII